MTSESSREALDNASIPICFDTNAIFDAHTGPLLLESVRERFPIRDLFIPIFVVAEIARRYKVRHGEQYDPTLTHILFVLKDKELRLKVIPFGNKLALNVWPAVTGKFAQDDWAWGWGKRPCPKKPRHPPCAERCRTGDHLIYALARSRNALLVTGDKPLLREVAQDDPGALSTCELKRFLGLDQRPIRPANA